MTRQELAALDENGALSNHPTVTVRHVPRLLALLEECQSIAVRYRNLCEALTALHGEPSDMAKFRKERATAADLLKRLNGDLEDLG